MNQKTKLIILIVLLAAVLTGAFFAYRYFSKSFIPAQPTEQKNETTAEADETTEDNADKAADFTVFDKDKKEIALSSRTGKPVVINFWATWCPPCQSELPAYQTLYDTYGEKVDFMMVALTDGYQETQSSVDAFIEENGYTFPVFYDLQGAAAEAYAVNSIPLSVFIDADGKVSHSQLGAMDEASLEAQIKTLLGG